MDLGVRLDLRVWILDLGQLSVGPWDLGNYIIELASSHCPADEKKVLNRNDCPHLASSRSCGRKKALEPSHSGTIILQRRKLPTPLLPTPFILCGRAAHDVVIAFWVTVVDVFLGGPEKPSCK